MTVTGGRDEDCDRGVSLLRQEQYVHEAVYFDAAAGLVDATAPLLRRALARGEDVALVCSDANNRALAEALGERRPAGGAAASRDLPEGDHGGCVLP